MLRSKRDVLRVCSQALVGLALTSVIALTATAAHAADDRSCLPTANEISGDLSVRVLLFGKTPTDIDKMYSAEKKAAADAGLPDNTIERFAVELANPADGITQVKTQADAVQEVNERKNADTVLQVRTSSPEFDGLTSFQGFSAELSKDCLRAIKTAPAVTNAVTQRDDLMEKARASELADPKKTLALALTATSAANGAATVEAELTSKAKLSTITLTKPTITVNGKTPDIARKELQVTPGSTETFEFELTGLESDAVGGSATAQFKAYASFGKGALPVAIALEAPIALDTPSRPAPAPAPAQGASGASANATTTSPSTGGINTASASPPPLLWYLGGLVALVAAAGAGFVFGRNRFALAGSLSDADRLPPPGARGPYAAPPSGPAPAAPPPATSAWPTRPPALPGSWVRFMGPDPLVQIVDQDDALRVPPTNIECGTTWSVELDGVLAIGLWTEKVAGKGEDAAPTFLYDPHRGVGLVATYDGMGGSGAAAVRKRRDGSDVSGAYVASRLAREATQSSFKSSAEMIVDPPAVAAQLHDELASQFAVELERCLPTSGRIAGSLRRDLPTTLAACAFKMDPNGGVLALSLWAGDSRTHLLTAHDGMQQLSRDDTRDGDALQLLINDAPMNNVVCADRPFEINEHAIQLHAPALLVSGTDGCFGYVATPAHYELLILRALRRSSSADEWAAALATELAGFTSDDASLSLVALGFRDFADIQHAFADRTDTLEAEHAAPFVGASPDNFDAFSAIRLDSWERYRETYELLMAPGSTGEPTSAAAASAPVDQTADPGLAGGGAPEAPSAPPEAVGVAAVNRDDLFRDPRRR